ncbi:MAG: hypothetical protein U1G07_21020 [Verrucomicrobiota bacterium]
MRDIGQHSRALPNLVVFDEAIVQIAQQSETFYQVLCDVQSEGEIRAQ